MHQLENREENLWLVNLMENAANIAFRTDGETFLKVIGAPEHICGMSSDELINKSLAAVFSNNDDITAMFRRVRRNGVINDFATTIIGYDGVLVPVMIDIIHNQSNNIFECLVRSAVLHDAAMCRLRQSEEKFMVSFYANPIMSAISDAKSGYIINVNNAWLNTLGFERNEVIGKTAGELNIWRNINERDKIILMPSDDRNSYGTEVQFKTKNGKIIDVIVFKQPVTIDDEVRILFNIIDITEYKSAIGQNSILINALNNISLPILIINKNGRISYLNSQFLSILGYNFDELLSQHIRILHGNDNTGWDNMWSELMNGKEWQGLINLRCKDDSYIVKNIKTIPILDNSDNKSVSSEQNFIISVVDNAAPDIHE